MTPRKPLKKAVFPVAGLGTRFLPATKSIPKEMLPIVDKPLIQYAVEEALEAGIESLIFVTSRRKHAISDHFDSEPELENHLSKSGKHELLERISSVIPNHISRIYVPQLSPRGLGHAVACARSAVGNEPFAVLLADDLIKSPDQGCLKQMAEVYRKTGDSVLAVETVAADQTDRYGIVDARDTVVRSIVEKPAPSAAPSNTGVVGRYILDGKIFELLDQTGPGAGGEIQLTDAIAKLLFEKRVRVHHFEGTRYDCGSQSGYIKATMAYALEHPKLRDELLEFVREFLV